MYYFCTVVFTIRREIVNHIFQQPTCRRELKIQHAVEYYFLTSFEMFGDVWKQCLECSIYLLSPDLSQGESKGIKSNKSRLFKIGYPNTLIAKV